MFIYFLMGSIYCLMSQGIIPVNAAVKANYAIINNYVDIPLMLLMLSLFATSSLQTKAINLTLISFIVYEILIFAIFKMSVSSSIWIMGPGIVVVMIFCIIFFTRCAKLSIERSKGFGKTLIVSSMLFLYGSYSLIYYLYYIEKTSATADVYFIYHLVLFIASVFISAGLILINRKAKQIREVQTTRKELAVFFGH